MSALLAGGVGNGMYAEAMMRHRAVQMPCRGYLGIMRKAINTAIISASAYQDMNIAQAWTRYSVKLTHAMSKIHGWRMRSAGVR
ncbi:hypothetical protein D7V89_08450 [Bifidobacterium pseudolongum]|uniref:Uncharacterized protein n=1 Tax=Bifidobacterium pseudolongum TaxID=1694 RepID=A0AB37NW66_9BIFI|nr:hypothetical protein [Bifidobacterium pseudolongum]RKI87105.1 hypothetical protein D7V89_08450 [Bifidobacterium pseudolongum]